MYSGGELIEVYKEFSRINSSARKDEYKIILLLHNHDDIEGMTRLLPLISYYALIQNAYDYESSTIENVVSYYLPSEDEAIHKSIAQYVDSSNRVKCTAANCYTRKTGAFVPEFGGTNTPVFKKSFSDSSSYICLDDTFLSDPDESRLYCQSVIKHILNR